MTRSGTDHEPLTRETGPVVGPFPCVASVLNVLTQCKMAFAIEPNDEVRFWLSIERRYFLECPEGVESPFAQPINTTLEQLPSPEDQAAIVSSPRNFLPSLTLPLSEVAVKFSRSDTLRGSVARQVAATATAGPTAAALGQVLAAPTTGHLAVLGATLGNLTSLVDCNAGGEFAANIVRPSLCSRSPSIVARVQNLSLHTNRFVFFGINCCACRVSTWYFCWSFTH